MKRARDAGMYEVECMEALGIPLQRLEAWREQEQRIAATIVAEPMIPRSTPSTALVPVSIDPDLPFGPMITFCAPSGYRIDGLTLDEAFADAGAPARG